MKQTIKLFLFLAFFTSFLLSNSNLQLTQNEQLFIKNTPTIKVGIEYDWPPFDYVENGRYKGFAKDYLDLITKQTGLNFQLTVDTWQNLLEKTKNKQLDLLPFIGKDKHREKFLLFTEKYITVRNYIFANSLKYNSMEDLKNKSIAITKGYIHKKYIEENYKSIKLVEVKKPIEAVDLLITNKVDAIVSDLANINYLKNQHNLVNIHPNFNFDKRNNDFYMATRDDYDILRNIIDKVLKNISYEQKQRIQDKWLMEKSSQKNNSINLTKEEEAYILQKRKLYIGNEFDWMPYSFSESNEAKGYIVDYIKLISKKINLEPIFITNTWSNNLNKFKNKELDILPAISKNKKREKFINFSDKILDQELTIITNSSSQNLITLEDLSEKKVAMIKKWNLTKKLKENYPNINVIEFDSIKDILDAIKNNFVDATVQNKIIAKYYINQNRYKGFLKTVGTVYLEGFNKELYIGIRKDLTTLHSIYNKAINSVTKEELEKIEAKWITSQDRFILSKEEKEFIKNNTINISFTTNWRPFSYEENGLPQGLAYDYLKLISKKISLKTNLIYENNFTKSLESIKNKSRDIILLTSDTKQREDYAVFSNTIFTTPIGIATLKDENYIQDASYLQNKKVAVGKNYTSKKLLAKVFPDIEFIETKDLKEALELLSDNEVFAVVDSMPVLSTNIKEHGFTNIKISGTTKVNFNMKMMIRKDYKILQNIINKVLFTLSEEEKKQIKDKWINIEYEESIDYSLAWKIALAFTLLVIYFIYKNRQLLNYQNELHKTKRNLENSLENFRQLLDENIAGIIIVKNNTIKYLNDELLNILEINSKEELLKQNVQKLFKNSSIEELIKKQEEDTFEYKLNFKNKKTIPVLLKIKEINYENQSSYIVSIIDLTDIKNKEELLLQQSKMASLGEMIGNIAHQWRQPLSTISTASSGLKLQKEFGTLNDEIFTYSLDTITNTTQFLSQTINDFQNYIKDDKKAENFKISESFEKVLSILNTSFLNYNIEIIKNINDIEIYSFKNELNQVLLNIFANSKDALKQCKQKEKYIFINSYTKNSKAIIEIIDTGGGIKKELLNKVFEPYFTTKHKSQGTGLGLYMTHKIVSDSMKGQIKIENCKYKNNPQCTKVSIILPIK